MLRNLLFVAVIAIVLVACNNSGNDATALNINDFDKVAGEYVGKAVQIEGTVKHVCQHGGRRMFVFNDNPAVNVKVTAPDSIPAFDVNLVDGAVIITGIVEELRIDEAYLAEWEAELKALEPEVVVVDSLSAETTTEVATTGTPTVEATATPDTTVVAEVAPTEEVRTSEKSDALDRGDHIDSKEMIASYRKQIAESGSDHISLYSISCTEVKKKE